MPFFVHTFRKFVQKKAHLQKKAFFKTEFAIFNKKGILCENFDFHTKKRHIKKGFLGKFCTKKGTKTNCQKRHKKGTSTKKKGIGGV